MALKHLHVSMVVLSIAFFALRGAWMLADSALLQRRVVRIAPHVIDTVLLVSALALAWTWASAPGAAHGWLAAKVIGLVAYVVLGSIALKRGRTKSVRTVALAGALATVAYVVAVALTKQPLPGLSA